MKVLSIQSHVVCGHVGNAAAVFPLQLLGVEALPLHTVQYSNHPGRGGFRGAVTDAATIGDLAAGLDELGALAECNAVLTGYVADAVGSRAVHDAALLVKRRNPRAVYCCDPVMGDVEDGFFVAEEVRAHFIDVAAPAADIVTPNGFELAALTGIEPATVEEALAACAALCKRGPTTVIASGLRFRDDEISAISHGPDGTWMVTTPRLSFDRRPDGAGDLFAAIWLGNRLTGRDDAAALSRAAASTLGVLRATLAAAAPELEIVAARGEIIEPTSRFPAVRLG